MKNFNKIHILVLGFMLYKSQTALAQTNEAFPLYYLFNNTETNNYSLVYQKQIKDRQNTFKESRSNKKPSKLSDLSTSYQLQNNDTQYPTEIQQELIKQDSADDSWRNAQNSGLKVLDTSRIAKQHKKYTQQNPYQKLSSKKKFVEN